MVACNLHTHTVRSDGSCCAEEVVRCAIEKGFRTLGFSDHGHTPWYADGSLPADLSGYIAENRSLADKYGDRIEIVSGIENEFDCWQFDDSLQYHIGSRHCLPVGDEVFVIDESPEMLEDGIRRYYGGDAMAMVKDYYAHLGRDIPRFRPDIIGHFDLIRKFNRDDRFFTEESPSYHRAALEAAEAAGETGAIFEINTGSIARKRRKIFFPANFLLKFFLEKGYPVTISSDAHDPSLLDGSFTLAVKRLESIGFRSLTVWADGSFREIGIEDFLV